MTVGNYFTGVFPVIHPGRSVSDHQPPGAVKEVVDSASDIGKFQRQFPPAEG